MDQTHTDHQEQPQEQSQKQSQEKSHVIHTNTRKLHCGTPESGTNCGAKNSLANVDEDNPLAIVLKYGVYPCSRCIDRAYRLRHVYHKVHSASVINKDLTEITAPLPWDPDEIEYTGLHD